MVDYKLAATLSKRLYAFAKTYKPKIASRTGLLADAEYYNKATQK